jgi:hypothetical protein
VQFGMTGAETGGILNSANAIPQAQPHEGDFLSLARFAFDVVFGGY